MRQGGLRAARRRQAVAVRSLAPHLLWPGRGDAFAGGSSVAAVAPAPVATLGEVLLVAGSPCSGTGESEARTDILERCCC
jgi:hypothetical protein